MMLAAAFLSAMFAAAPSVPGDSVYALDSTWTDAAGHPMKLASLEGKPVVLAMIYTSCRAACPLTVADMKAIEKRLDDKTRANVRFVLVSFDPGRDTPAALEKLAQEHALDPSRWTLLTGNSDDVRDLAAVLGMKIRAAGGEFVHSSIITVLDASGVIRAQTMGVKQDPAGNAALLEKLAR